MCDELRRIRVQVLERFQAWGGEAAPAVRYARLVAGYFQLLADYSNRPLVTLSDMARVLIRCVGASVNRLADGQTLTRSDVDRAEQLAGQLVRRQPPNSLVVGPVVPPYVRWLLAALTDPGRSALEMTVNLEWSGLPWADPRRANVVRSHSALLGVAECLHPIRPVIIDARWRTADVLGLARRIREDGAFYRLPILADALSAAGCNNESILGHCRSHLYHVPGCWIIERFRQAPRGGNDRAA